MTPDTTRRECRCPRARHTHGTRYAYDKDGCRCFPCRVAWANSTRAYRNGQTWDDGYLVDGTGTRRRLEALATIGVTAAQVGALIGVTASAVSKLRTAHGTVSHRSHDAVRGAYDQLWDKPRTDPSGRKARTHAAKQGWPPPLAWDDDTIDNPDAEPCTGDTLPSRHDLRPCGTRAAYRRHVRAGEKPCQACVNAERRKEAA